MNKWVTTGMVAIMAASLLAACSNSANPKPAADGNAPKQKTKFSISMRTLAVNYVEKSPDMNKDKWVNKLEEMTNTDLDIRLVPHADFEQKMIQMFATNDIPDVVQASAGVAGKELAGSVQAGVFMPLDDLLQKYGQNLLKKIPKDAWDKEKYQGKIMAIPEFLSNPSRRATAIRKDLLDKAGLPVPKTVDDYLNVMRKFKQMGVEQPYQGRQNFKYADTFLGAFDAFPYLSQNVQQGDRIVPKFTNVDNMEKALQTYKTMFDEGLISKEFATINPTQYKNNILAGKAGIWSMNANEALQWEQQLQANVPTAKIELIPSPTGPDGKGGYYMYSPVTRAYFINKNVKDAASIVKFFDWMVSDEAEKFFTFGIEGQNYTVKDGKIDYKFPTDPAGVDEERMRQYWLWMVQDTVYYKGTLSLTEPGKKLMDNYDNMLSKEGRDGINFEPRLDALVKNPDIAPLADEPSPLLVQHMVKMVYGKESISDWPKVLEEWKSKGGSDLLKEATDRFNKKDPNYSISMPRR